MSRSETGASPDFTDKPDTSLQRRWMTLVHIIWAVLIMSTLVVFFASCLVYFAQLQHPCQVASCAPGQLSLSTARALRTLGLSLHGYATLSLLLAIVWSFVWFVVGGILAWRKYHDWMALLVALMLVMQGSESIVSAVEGSSSFWQFPALVLGFFAYLFLALVLVLFPNGRFVPRWSYWLVILYIPVSVQFNFFPNVTLWWITWSGNVLFVGLVISVLMIQVYRYWRVSDLVERQQTKWVVFSITLVLVLVVVSSFFPIQPGSFFSLIFGSNFTFPSLLIPLSLGIAILRYRLWDIDILIRRTLVYGLLTAILLGVYLVLVFVGQFLVANLLGRDNGAVLVVSTLMVYVLFQPMRQRVQQMVDRRFYRSKYDAAQIMADFNETLRHEVDLNLLCEQLLTVVQQTMQPTSFSLWLCSRQPQEEREQPGGNLPRT